MCGDRSRARARWRAWTLALAVAGACEAPAGRGARDVPRRSAAQPLPALDAADNCGVITGYELTLSGLGAMRVGRPVEEIRRTCTVISDDTTEVGSEDHPSRVLTVRTPHGDAEVLVDSGRVSAVEVAVPTLRTSDSLGVGTTLARLLRIDGTVGAEDDWGVFVAPGGRCGLNFALAYDLPNPRIGHVWSTDELATLPPGLRVRKVYASASSCPDAPVGADRDDHEPP